jgi:hypothetical protein
MMTMGVVKTNKGQHKKIKTAKPFPQQVDEKAAI